MIRDILIRIVATILSSLFVLSASAGTVIHFTNGEPITAERQDYCFDNDKLLIGGYNYNQKYADEEHVQYVKDAGIDFLISGTSETFLNLCDEIGVGVIAKGYNAPSLYGTTNDAAVAKWMSISESNYKYAHNCVWGDDLIDEPSAAVFDKLSEIVNHYYDNTTDKIVLINLFPMYANNTQLGNDPQVSDIQAALLPFTDYTNKSVDQYKRHVSDYINKIDTDYISVDIYPLSYVMNEDGTLVKKTNNLWLRNLDVLGEACRETGRDLWVITQATGQTDKENGMRFCSADDIRWQAYVSLAFGTKALIHACYNSGWWNSDSHLIDPNGKRTDTYYAAQKIDFELKAFADVYGDYENKGAYLVNPVLSAGTDSGYLIPLDDEYKPSVKSTSPVLVGCFTEENGDGRAYSIVNMWEPETGNEASAKIVFEDATEITVYRKGQRTITSGDTLNIRLDSCEGVFVTVK